MAKGWKARRLSRKDIEGALREAEEQAHVQSLALHYLARKVPPQYQRTVKIDTDTVVELRLFGAERAHGGIVLEQTTHDGSVSVRVSFAERSEAHWRDYVPGALTALRDLYMDLRRVRLQMTASPRAAA